MSPGRGVTAPAAAVIARGATTLHTRSRPSAWCRRPASSTPMPGPGAWKRHSPTSSEFLSSWPRASCRFGYHRSRCWCREDGGTEQPRPGPVHGPVVGPVVSDRGRDQERGQDGHARRYSDPETGMMKPARAIPVRVSPEIGEDFDLPFVSRHVCVLTHHACPSPFVAALAAAAQSEQLVQSSTPTRDDFMTMPRSS